MGGVPMFNKKLSKVELKALQDWLPGLKKLDQTTKKSQ